MLDSTKRAGHALASPFAGADIDVTYDKHAPFLDDPISVKPGDSVQVRRLHTNSLLSLYRSR